MTPEVLLAELRAMREALATIVDGLDAILAGQPDPPAPTAGELLEAYHERHEAAVRSREDHG